MGFGQVLPSRGGMGGREAWNTWVSFSFLLKGKENKIVWIIGGASTYLCAKRAASQGGGFRGVLPREILILDLLLDAIWWNLGLLSHKRNLPSPLKETLNTQSMNN